MAEVTNNALHQQLQNLSVQVAQLDTRVGHLEDHLTQLAEDLKAVMSGAGENHLALKLMQAEQRAKRLEDAQQSEARTKVETALIGVLGGAVVALVNAIPQILLWLSGRG